MVGYRIQGTRLEACENLSKEGKSICICSVKELEDFLPAVSPSSKKECSLRGPSKLESFEGYDFILLNLPEQWREENRCRLGIYLLADSMIFVCGSSWLPAFFNRYVGKPVKGLSLSYLLHAFFLTLVADDMERLLALEDSITELETRVMQGDLEGCRDRFLPLRRALAGYHTYYEQLLDVAEGMEENENGLLGAAFRKPFQRFTARVERLLRTVENLREDVSRSYEDYQSQVDINLNKTMKVLTVITSVFLPLSLIVGWYGMNFRNMPELGWPYGYGYVMILCVIVVGLSLLYLKKKKF